MSIDKMKWFKWIAELQALAQSGITYTQNPFDKENYLKLKEISAEMFADCSDSSLDEIEKLFTIEKGHATPKVAVRAFIIEQDKILLVREKCDGLWTLPGGWADVGQSPGEATIKEVKEEAGFDVKIVKLLALWDKMKHEHPLQWPQIYKCFFHCEITGGEPQVNIEISEIDFFALNKIPPLSTPRVTEKQLRRLYEVVKNNEMTQFD